MEASDRYGTRPGGEPYRVPLDKVSDWADILELEGEDREVFLLAALLEHGGSEYREIVERVMGKGRRRRR